MAWPPLGPDDPPETRIDGKHHVGCIVSQDRAIKVASLLFRSEVRDGSDCGMGGDQSCPICRDANQVWIERVREVRAAMMEAFR